MRVVDARHVEQNLGSLGYFRDRVIIDCGAGSGMQSRWMLEAGARRVISLELSSSVDGVLRRNLAGFAERSLVVQCDIGAPPVRAGAIPDLVYCINVIQHTKDPTKTTAALYRLVAPGGMMIVNYYMRREGFTPFMLLREPLRRGIARARVSKQTLMTGCRVLAALGMVPVLDSVLVRTILVRGEVPRGPSYLRRKYRQTLLNTYDWYGLHDYQYYFRPSEMPGVLDEAGVPRENARNLQEYCAARRAGYALQLVR